MTEFKPPAPRYTGPPAHHSGTGNKPIHRVVIHSTVSECKRGGADDISAYFRSEKAGGSAHYVVDPGAVRQAAFDSFVCWHAPPNAHSLGIEMCDMPGPVPNEPRGSAAFKALKRSWRWIRPNQRRMLRRTARLTAELCLAYDVPIRFVGAKALAAGKHGITTHANVSQAWHQSTHWDPGFWPRRSFMRQVRRHAKRLTEDKRPKVVVSWNAKVGRGKRQVGRDLAQLLRDEKPDAVLLQEAMHYVGWFRLRFAKGWRVYAGGTWDEARNCPVMVRRSVPRGKRRGKGWDLVRNCKPWVFAKSKHMHPGRTWTWAGAFGVPLLSVHRATGGNPEAANEEAESLVDWFAEHSGPMLAAGDMNRGPDRTGPDSSAAVAREVHGDVVAPGEGGIDHGIARGLKVEATRGEKYGSDHHCVRYEIQL